MPQIRWVFNFLCLIISLSDWVEYKRIIYATTPLFKMFVNSINQHLIRRHFIAIIKPFLKLWIHIQVQQILQFFTLLKQMQQKMPLMSLFQMCSQCKWVCNTGFIQQCQCMLACIGCPFRKLKQMAVWCGSYHLFTIKFAVNLIILPLRQSSTWASNTTFQLLFWKGGATSPRWAAASSNKTKKQAAQKNPSELPNTSIS